MDHQHTKSALGIDWQSVKERLSRSETALAAIEQLSPAQAKELMDQRAAMLARVPEQTPDSSEVIEVMTFQLGKERMAIETRFVHEVTRPNEITPLPGSPDFLVGLTNLRGDVMPVMDLRHFFKSATDQATDQTTVNSQVLVLGEEQMQFGIVADSVDDVRMQRIDAILTPPGSMTGVSRDFLRGVTSDAMLVLDGKMLMKDEQLYIDQSDT